MQFMSRGRFRVIRRIEGLGKEMRESRGIGGGVVKAGEEEEDILGVLEGLLKERTGMAARERV